MSLMTRTDKTTPLSPDALRNIAARHPRIQESYGSRYDVFHECCIYKLDGSFVGTSGQPEAADAMHLLIAVSSHHTILPGELEAIRVHKDGHVEQPGALRHHDPVDLPDVVPEPEPRLRPATTIGDRVASLIRTKHMDRVPQEVRYPGRGRATPYVPPVDLLLYAATDGRSLGSAMALDGRENQHRAVRLRTDELPSVEQIAAIQVDEYGVVGDVQP